MFLQLQVAAVSVFISLLASSGAKSQAQQSSPLAPASTATQSAPPSQPAALSFPGMTGPLTLPPPWVHIAGPAGQWDIGGIVSGSGFLQSNSAASDTAVRAEFSNAQAFVQKPTGLVQFYMQAGAYNFPALGAPLLSTSTVVTRYFGPIPVVYLQLSPSASFSIAAGKLPTLIGGESTFTFQNFSMERGLLWNQTNEVYRGVQVNYAHKKLATNLVWDDGFYSDRWNWLVASAAYSFTPQDTLTVIGSGNLGRTAYSSLATPALQNNSTIDDIIYLHKAKSWMIQPYF